MTNDEIINKSKYYSGTDCTGIILRIAKECKFSIGLTKRCFHLQLFCFLFVAFYNMNCVFVEVDDSIFNIMLHFSKNFGIWAKRENMMGLLGFSFGWLGVYFIKNHEFIIRG